MTTNIETNEQFKALSKLAKYIRYRPGTSDKNLDSSKRDISLEAIRIILTGGSNETMLAQLKALQSKNAKLRGFQLNNTLTALITKIELNVLICPTNNNILTALPTEENRDFLYKSMTKLGNYISVRHNSKKHNPHKLGIVNDTFNTLFSNRTSENINTSLNELRSQDISYEKKRGEIKGISATEFDTYTLRGCLRKIIKNLRNVFYSEEDFGSTNSASTVTPPVLKTQVVQPSAPPSVQHRPSITTSNVTMFQHPKESKRISTSEKDTINDLLVCPISQEIIKDPVMAADGHTYERHSIEAWFKQSRVSPITNIQLNSLAVTPNYMIKSIIDKITADQLDHNHDLAM